MPLTILHLGLGAFHRAHQAVYQQRLLDIGANDWQLTAGNLRPDPSGTEAALLASHGVYTLETVSPSGERHQQRIAALQQRIIAYAPDLAELIAVGADSHTRIISFTVTEAGYYLDDQGRLDFAAANGPEATLYSVLAAMLRARRAANAGPVTLLSCDNLRHNGDCTRTGLLQFLDQLNEPELLAWTQANTSFPNAMVDRITPRPQPNQADLMAEEYLQWVIEDRFIAGRPDWARVGAQMVDAVEGFEEAKIRMLNASHSCIAWAGALIQLRFIHEGLQNEWIRRVAHDFLTDDVIPVLAAKAAVIGLDLPAYRDTVLSRFANAALADTVERVAADGFAKLPGFIAPTIAERLARGESIASVALLPALFLAFLRRWNAGQLPFEYRDGAMEPARARAICAAEDPLAAFCADVQLWGTLAGDARLLAALRVAAQQVDGEFTSGKR